MSDRGLDTIRAALAYIPACDRELWLRMGMAIKSELGEDGFDIWSDWSKQDESYNERDARDVWRSIKANGKTTIGTLYHEAQRHGFRFNGNGVNGYHRPAREAKEGIVLCERQRPAEEARQQQCHAEAAAKKAITLWKAAQPAANDHPYLVRKGIRSVETLREIPVDRAADILGYRPQAKGEPLVGRLLIAPVKVGGEPSTVEMIDEAGRKSAVANGAKAGGYWDAQLLPEGDGTDLTLLIGEGVATVLSSREATGHPVLAALSSGNLKAVAQQMRERYTKATLVILADLGNGQEKAVEAARAVNGLIAIPDFGEHRPDGAKDFNDLHRTKGAEAVRSAIANAKAPGIPEAQGGEENAPERASEADEATIERLAGFSQIEYERVREAEAEKLGVRVGILDKLVGQRRSNAAEGDLSGRPLVFAEVEPWPNPVDGAALLDELGQMLKRFLVLAGSAVEAIALWIVHTYAFDLRRCTPILAVRSPEKRCGKTTLLSLLLATVNRPLPASNISPSAVYRTIEKAKPTLLIDEADSFLRENEELRGVLNSGHTRELAFVIRNVGNVFEPRQFSTWAPKALALIGKLPDTLHDRAIVIPMHRKAPPDRVERFEGVSAEDLKRRIARWVADNSDEIKGTDPEIPDGLHDRAADNWRPLLAIAEMAGGDWRKTARAAALALSGGDEAEADSNRVLLLFDLRQLFKERNTDVLTSAEIVKGLAELNERPWPEYTKQGKSITQRQLAALLSPFNIKPKQIWIAGKNERGYEREQFDDVFCRYLPDLSARPLDPNNGARSDDSRSARDKNDLADGKTPKPTAGNGSSTLADENPWRMRI